MQIKYLMDENLDPIYQIQLRRKEPDLVVWAIGDPNTPPKGTLDPDILLWCEKSEGVTSKVKASNCKHLTACTLQKISIV